MTSSTSLYTTANAANTSGGNYTTLYSGGAGVTVPQRAYGNANVVSLLAAGSDGANTVAGIVATGNITTTNKISATGNISTAGWFLGNIQGDITGNIAAAGSNTELQFNNNNSLGASANLTFNNSTNVLNVTGNIVGSNVIGTVVNGATITSAGNVIGGNVLGGTVTATGNIVGGNIRTAGVVTATGNVTGSNLITAGLVSAATISATGNVTGGNILTPGTITAAGNITAPNFIGNISGNIDAGGSNTQVQFNDNDLLSGSAGFTFDKTTNAVVVAGNVTGGNINTAGTVSTTGNVVAGNVITNILLGTGNANVNLKLSPSGNATSNVAGSGAVEIVDPGASLIVNSGVIQSRQGPGSGNPLTLRVNNGSGNGTASIVINDITSGGLAGEIGMYPIGNSFTGQLPYVRIYGGGLVFAPLGNRVGNILAANSTMTISSISASGNITGNYFLGNGSQLTGVVSVIQGNLGGNLQGNGYGANAFTFVSAVGNVTAGNIITSGLITATGNITSGGNISAVGNVYGGNLIGPPAQNIGVFADDSYNIHLNADLIRVGDLDTQATIVTNGTGNLVLTTNDDGLTDKSKITIVQGANANILLTTTGVGQVVTSSLYATTRLTSPSIYAIGGPGAVISSTGNVDALYLNGTVYGDLFGGAVSVTGNVTGGNLRTGGDVLATGNISGASVSVSGNVTGNYIIGNGSLLTGLPAGYSNADVSTYLASGTNSNNIITTANVTGGNLTTGGAVIASGNISASAVNATNEVSAGGNVIGGNVSTGGAVSATGDITTRGALVGNTVQPTFPGPGNSRDLTLNAYGSGNININGPIVTTYAFTTDGNITTQFGNLNATFGGAYTEDGFFGTAGYSQVNVAGNVTGGNIISNAAITGGTANITSLLTAGNITSLDRINAFGNITSTSGVFTGNGSGLTDLVTLIQGNLSGNLQGNTYGANAFAFVSATGNINGANLVASANLTSTQQTVIGTANVGTTGNIVVSGKNIATDMAWNPDGGNALTGSYGRVVVGTGWNGNITHTATQSRLSPTDSISRTNTATAVRQFNAESIVTLNGNATNGSFRQQGSGSQIRIGGGSAANTVALTNGGGSIFAVAAGQFNLEIGNVSPYFLGNTTLSHAVVHGGVIQPAIGSTVTNAFGFNCLIGAPTGTSIGNVTNYTGYSTSIIGATGTGNIFMFYNGNNTSATNRSVSVNNTARSAAAYYAFMNEDDVAQIQLGSLRRYHQFESPTATSGSFAVDKNVAQVHNIVPTGNCTITGYSNMVVNANDGTNNDAQIDTLTIIVEQGATPYTVTLPTGATYKYASGNSTVGSTANAVTIVTVVAANVSGTTTYMTTVSPEFV